MRLLLVLAFVVVPLVELAVVIQVGSALGVGWTVLLLLAVSLVGAALVRREGSRAWQAFRRALASGRPPAKEVADGVMLLVGGTLLLTPGFITDVVGLLLVLPPTRALLRRRVTGAIARRLVVSTLGGPAGPGGPMGPGGLGAWPPGAGGAARGPAEGRPGSGRSGDRVVEGEVVDGPDR